MKTKLTLALTAALLLGASAARAVDYSQWVYSDDGSANRTPSIGLSETWQGLFHWEYFTALAQQKISHFFASAIILK